MKKPIKRFIAGAVCPRCGEMDKLVMFKQGGKDLRECVSCGFKDELRFKKAPKELETRVNITEEMKKTEIQVLTLDPKNNNSKH